MSNIASTVLAVLTLLLPVVAAAQRCDPYITDRATFEVRVQPPSFVEVDHSKTSAELARMSGADNRKVLGLTQARFGVRAFATRNHWGCHVVVLEVVGWGQVYVSADLDAGSCEYQQTLAHERNHGQINTDALERIREEYANHMGTAAYSPTRLLAYVKDDLVPEVNHQLRSVQALHKRFDAEDKAWRKENGCAAVRRGLFSR